MRVVSRDAGEEPPCSVPVRAKRNHGDGHIRYGRPRGVRHICLTLRVRFSGSRRDRHRGRDNRGGQDRSRPVPTESSRSAKDRHGGLSLQTVLNRSANGQARRPVPTMPPAFDHHPPMIHNRSITAPNRAISKLRASSNKGLTKPEYLPHYHKCRVIHESSRIQGRPLNPARITTRKTHEAGTRLLKPAHVNDPAKPGRRRPKRFRAWKQISRGRGLRPTANHATNPPPVS